MPVALSASLDTADVGQAVVLTMLITDDSGALVDPATCTLTLTLPDASSQTVLIGALTHAGTGNYTYSMVGSQTGQVYVKAVCTVPNAADDTVFTVTGSPSPVSLDYVKAHLNMSGITADDAELKSVIDAAVDLAEDICGPIQPRTVTEVHTECDSIVLRCFPVISVQSVTPSAGTIGSYVLNPGGVVNLYQAYSFQPYGMAPTTVTVTYTAGRATVSAKMQLAIAELVRHLWQTQQGSRSRQTQPDEWIPSGATTRFAMELFGRDALGPGIG